MTNAETDVGSHTSHGGRNLLGNLPDQMNSHPPPLVGDDFYLRPVKIFQVDHGRGAVEGLGPSFDKGFFSSPSPGEVLVRVEFLVGVTPFKGAEYTVKATAGLLELFGKTGDMDEVNTDGGGDWGHALNSNLWKVLAKVESTFLKSEP